jgi:hypothetical protein
LIPIELVAFYRYQPLSLRLGGGISYHVANIFSTSGSLLDQEITFNSALGALVVLEYFLNEKCSFSGNATFVSYRAQGGSADIKGNSLGLAFNLFF